MASRSWLSFRRVAGVLAALAVAALLFLALRPIPVGVDLGVVSRGPLRITIDEEAKTRVREMYVVSAPVTGRLMRIEIDPGDPVEANATVLARLLPSDPSFLDVRTLSQAEAEVRSAEAALALARAEVGKARAELEFAVAEVRRARELVKQQTLSKAALDRHERDERAARATLATAVAEVKVREAQLENARARLIDPTATANAGSPIGGIVAVSAPVSGTVLRVLQESETVVSSGTPLIEIGDPQGDLEVVAELLSEDAVQVQPGQRVWIDDWGGAEALEGVVNRVEPFGFTKISALGVEEQRVNVIVRFRGDPAQRASLGHGFRVEARIVVWESDDVLRVPSSALFRHRNEWAVFVSDRGRAELRAVQIGRNNGSQAEVIDGLAEGEAVVLYPSDRIEDGTPIEERTLS